MGSHGMETASLPAMLGFYLLLALAGLSASSSVEVRPDAVAAPCLRTEAVGAVAVGIERCTLSCTVRFASI